MFAFLGVMRTQPTTAAGLTAMLDLFAERDMDIALHELQDELFDRVRAFVGAPGGLSIGLRHRSPTSLLT